MRVYAGRFVAWGLFLFAGSGGQVFAQDAEGPYQDGWEEGSWDDGEATFVETTPATGRPLSPPAPRGFDFRALERSVHDEMNRMRANPRAYAARLEARRGSYDGLSRIDENGTRILLNEGLPALDEAIAALEAAHRLPRFAWSDVLHTSANAHATDLNRHDLVGHTSSDGGQLEGRIGRVGTWTGWIAENIAFGPRTGEDVVIGLIVDDGVANRGHREVLLQPDLFVAGTACGPHPTYGVVCVINYASRIEPKGGVARAAVEAPPTVADEMIPDQGFIEEDLAIIDDAAEPLEGHRPMVLPDPSPVPAPEAPADAETVNCPWVDDAEETPELPLQPAPRAEPTIEDPNWGRQPAANWPILDPRYPADHPRNLPPHLREVRRPIMQTGGPYRHHGRQPVTRYRRGW
jgi:hypothetical protein